MSHDLDAILRTVREVEASIERREQRAGALVMVVWGIAAASIFACYQWAARDPAPLTRVVGVRGLDWLWAPPIALAYLFTALARVRLGRMDAKRGSASARRLLVSILVPIAAIVLIELTGVGWQAIPAMMVAYLGYSYVGWERPGAGPRDRIIGIASFALGALLLLPMLWPWANGIAAAWYAVFLAGVGIVRYHR